MVRANIPHVITDDSALGGQLIGGSLRFNRSNGSYLSRTFSGSSYDKQKTWTWSAWIKFNTVHQGTLFSGSPTCGGSRSCLYYENGQFITDVCGVGAYDQSDGRYRDTNSWYHIVWRFDTTNATAADRSRVYVNGTEISMSHPRTWSQNVGYGIGKNELHTIGVFSNSTGNYPIDANMAEMHFISELSLDPSYFGYTDSQTGIWRPKRYTGAYNTTGFYLPLDGSNHIGKDMSGNGCDWTPTKLSGTVPIGKATGAFPIMNTNNGATVPLPGFRPDPFASNLVLASTFSDPSDVLDVHSQIKGSGSGKGLFVTGTTKEISQSNFYGRSGSLYFDGSSDYINLNATSDFNFGTGDFTIEFWMYSGVNSTDGFYRRLWMTDGPTENAVGNFQIAIVATTGVINLWEDGSGLDLLGTTNVTTSSWNHIAAVRSGSTLKLYVNGREDASTTYTTAISPNSGSPRPRIGNYNASSGAGDYNGYLQDYRVYKGVAKYTEEFLCGAVDSSVVQDSPSGIAIPRKLDPTIGGSTGFNVEGCNILLASNSDLTLNGDFTIEFWIYLESIATDGGHNPSIITFPAEASQGIIGQVYINASNKYYSLYNSNDGDIGRSAYKSAKTGRWQYITITRSSNAVKLFIDGVLSGDATNSTTYGNPLGVMRLGGYTRTTGMVDGHISNLRIIKGTALYTSSFTPPTEPLTNVTNTKLLCFQSKTDVEDVTVNPNSSTVNNQNWFKTGTVTSNSSMSAVSEVLDYNQYTFFGADGNSSAEATYTFPGSGIPFTKLEISGSNYAGIYVKVNGTTFTNWGTQFSNPPFHNVTSVGSPLTSITVKGNGTGQTSTMSAIRINDTITVAPDFANDPRSGDEASASNFSPFDTDIIHKGPSQYATLNSLAHDGVTLSNGGLTNTGGNDIPSNMGVKTGKFYVEVRIDTAYGSPNLKHLGIFATGTRTFRAANSNSHIINQLDGIMIRSDNAGPYTYTGRGGITSVAVVGADTDVIYTLGDIVGIQLDMDNKFVKFYINGVLRVKYTFVLASTFDKMYFFGRNNGSGKTTWNFGQKPYRYTPPTEFLPLASHNLESSSILKPQRFFDILTYTGDDASVRAITGLEFKPDLVWIKSRSTASTSHGMINSVCEDGSGNKTMLYPNDNAAETVGGSYFALYTATGLQPFIGNGFRINNNSSGNGSGRTFVAWCWKAGGDSNTFNIDDVGYATAAAAGLNGGTANPTGASVNTKAGFSIISYTATNNQNVSYSHGLNQAPEIIIVKDRDNSRNWGVYYNILGTNTNWLKFDDTDAQGSNNSSVTPVGGTSNTYMHLHQDYFAPSYNAFANGGNDGNDKLIAYMWHSVPGYSKMGSYKGNGSANGPYIDCGFKPALVIAKRITNADNWLMKDSTRNTYNSVFSNLNPNTNNAEFGSSDDTNSFDFYSNGFKVKGTNGAVNADGDSFIFMAWAEQPEVTPFGSQSNAR